MSNPNKVVVVYDPECPVCDFYCKRVVPLTGAAGIELVNAREDTEIVPEITAQGWDIDEGMVVKVGEALYYGAEAIHQLALVSKPKGLIGPMGRMFRNRQSAHRLYPILRNVRNALLKFMGKTRINNLRRRGYDRF